MLQLRVHVKGELGMAVNACVLVFSLEVVVWDIHFTKYLSAKFGISGVTNTCVCQRCGEDGRVNAFVLVFNSLGYSFWCLRNTSQ